MTNRSVQTGKTFGQVIRDRRIQLGITQEQLAERIGENVRQSDVSRMERDYIALPRRDRLEALAAALDVTPGYLLMHSGWITSEERARLDAPTPPAQVNVENVEVPEPYLDPWEEPSGHFVALSSDVSTGFDADNTVSSLHEALARARQQQQWTSDLLRETSVTLESARRTRRRNDSARS